MICNFPGWVPIQLHLARINIDVLDNIVVLDIDVLVS